MTVSIAVNEENKALGGSDIMTELSIATLRSALDTGAPVSK